jgi:pimeloyl-ACP methyl ester carboxylesterase
MQIPSIRAGQFADLAGGIRLHYASAGQAGAPLMLFVHGFPEFWGEWEALLPEFGRDFYAVAPDLRGFNRSSKPAAVAQYKPKLIVADLVALIAHLGYEKATIVAHDWGGAVCWNLAIMYPQAVERLVIINSPHPYPFMRGLRDDPAQQKASEYMNWLRVEGSETALAKDNFALLEGFFQKADAGGWYTPALRAKYHAAWSTPGEGGSHSLTGGVNYYRASPLHPPTEAAPGPAALQLRPDDWRVLVPTLVIWGELDIALLPRLLDGLDEVVSDLTLRRIPDGSHWVIHEQPALIASYIRAFLQAVPARANPL